MSLQANKMEGTKEDVRTQETDDKGQGLRVRDMGQYERTPPCPAPLRVLGFSNMPVDPRHTSSPVPTRIVEPYCGALGRKLPLQNYGKSHPAIVGDSELAPPL